MPLNSMKSSYGVTKEQQEDTQLLPFCIAKYYGVTTCTCSKLL